jgi:hypothetical protein
VRLSSPGGCFTWPWLSRCQPVSTKEPARLSRIEPAYLAADTGHMAKKSEPPAKPVTWSIYKVAAKAIWLGTVEAPDKDAAIEKGAQEFKTDAWRLYAVRRP